LFWFNPLVYWAWSRFRFDQEVACDAAVIRKAKVSRRRYARALARTHLRASGAIAFGWRRRHPLIERIALLGRPAPSHARRLVGYALAVVLMFSGAYVVWVASSGAKVT
jgi:bla regulator protein blaR1